MSKKALYGIITILCAGVLTLVAGIGSSWFTNGNIKTWFNSWGKDKQEVVLPDNTDNDNNVSDDLVNVTEEKGISLMSLRLAPSEYEEYGIDAQADTAYSIKASVNSDAVDKSVIGGLAWKNASSAWASGKNLSDYAVLNQTTEYGLDFTLTIKQAFGEPIIIKVASRLDMNVNATAQVDYLKEVTSFTATLNSSLGTAVGRIYVGDTNNTISVTPVYSVGTVAGTVTACKTTFTINDYVTTNLSNALKAGNCSSFFVTNKVICQGLTFNFPLMSSSSIDGGYNGLIYGGGNPIPPQTIANNFIKQYGCTTAAGSSAYTAGVTAIQYDITYSYNNEYSKTLTYTSTAFVGFRNDNLTAIATISNITLDKTGIVVVP